jgi:energy-coupling factor transporter transmembrane protein EcfT
MKLREWYEETVDFLADYFRAESYRYEFGYSERFPSLMSLVFRFVLRYSCFFIPGLWVLSLITGIIEKFPFGKLLIVSPFATVWYAFLLVLAFAVLMLIESFCKIITSLILYGEPPKGAENPPDALIMYFVK